MKIGKYEFNSKKQADTKIKSLVTAKDEDGNVYPTHKHAIQISGHIEISKEVLGEKGEVIEATVYSKKYSVDVQWMDLKIEPKGWKKYNIDLKTEGSHGFGGASYLENKI